MSAVTMEKFLNPYRAALPPPEALDAARLLQRELEERFGASLLAEHGGKMFGLLLAQNASGQWHTLKAFSGMLNGQWQWDGFVPPVFDLARRQAMEGPLESEVKRLFARTELLRASSQRHDVMEKLKELEQLHAIELSEWERAALEAKQKRQRLRAQPCSEEELLNLAKQSRESKAQKKQLLKRQREQRETWERQRHRLVRRLQASERLHRYVCRKVQQRLFDTYELRNFRNENKGLRELFGDRDPPSGAGDCSAPKLLMEAWRQNLHPRVLVEFFWGKAPASGARRSGQFYVPCKDKCGPLLDFMMRGLRVSDDKPLLPKASTKSPFRVVHQELDWLVVEKPEGVLSVPGKWEQDSVLTQLRAQFPQAEGPILVHRLDMETSGLLLAALTPKVHTFFQKQFLERTVKKTYIAWVEGELEEEEGDIHLPLCLNPDDRPRQIVSEEFGKPAWTHWRVTHRKSGRTRLELFPHTGRTHQLRVHASHPRGLNAPIRGDSLYGTPDVRLFLHAAELEIQHPHTGQKVRMVSQAPF